MRIRPGSQKLIYTKYQRKQVECRARASLRSGAILGSNFYPGNFGSRLAAMQKWHFFELGSPGPTEWAQEEQSLRTRCYSELSDSLTKLQVANVFLRLVRYIIHFWSSSFPGCHEFLQTCLSHTVMQPSGHRTAILSLPSFSIPTHCRIQSQQVKSYPFHESMPSSYTS